MPSANVNVSGTWHAANAIYVKVSGVWQPVQFGWVNVSGTWEEFFQAFSGITYTFTTPGSGTVAVPAGAHSMQAYVIGAGGSGQLKGSGNYGGGGGAGGGAGGQDSAIVSSDWGTTISYTVGGNVADANGGNSSLSVTLPSIGSLTSLAGNGGQYGASGGAGGTSSETGAWPITDDAPGSAGGSGGGGTGGTGGARFGGSLFIPGCAGVAGETGSSSPAASNGNQYGGGGGGGKHNRGLGADGIVVIQFSP